MKKVVTILAENFKAWGLTHVFGIPGKAISPLILETAAQNIEYVTSRHESGAGFEAAGYALTTNTIGVAMVTSGPGGTNLLTAAGQAKAFNVPVLFITGHPPIKDSGKALGQDSSYFATDLVKMFEQVTLFSARVERGELLPVYLRHAIEKACTGPRGPVHLCIPFDVFFEEIEPFEIPLPRDISPAISPDLEQVIPYLNEAKKPVLFLGKGVCASNAYEEARRLAEHWHIPVITTPGGKGAFPTIHPLSLGGFGLGGTPQANEYLKSGIDLMIVVGSKLSDMSLSGFTREMYPERVIQLDCDLTFVGKSIPVPTLAVLGDAKQNLKRLLELVNSCGQNNRDQDVESVFSRIAANFREAAVTDSVADKPETGEKPLSSVNAIKALRSALPTNALLFGDDGSHTFYAIRHFEIYEPGTFYFDDVFGAMGHAIGYAIGAKIGQPQRPVVCLTGDGCALMHGTEFSTAANYRIPTIFVVLNNGRLDMVDKGMSLLTGKESVGAVYDTPLDVSAFAKSMGASAFRCHTETDIEAAVKYALTFGGPTIVEIMVDPHELPPTSSRALELK